MSQNTQETWNDLEPVLSSTQVLANEVQQALADPFPTNVAPLVCCRSTMLGTSYDASIWHFRHSRSPPRSPLILPCNQELWLQQQAMLMPGAEMHSKPIPTSTSWQFHLIPKSPPTTSWSVQASTSTTDHSGHIPNQTAAYFSHEESSPFSTRLGASWPARSGG